MLYFTVCIWSDRRERTAGNAASHLSLHCLSLIQLFKTLKLVVNCNLFKFLIKYGYELRCLNTKGKYG